MNKGGDKELMNRNKMVSNITITLLLKKEDNENGKN